MQSMHSDAPMRIIEPRRVLIAEDHPLYREALRAVIPQVCTTACIAEAGCQGEVLEQLTPEADFDLVLLDLDLPGAEGLSCLRRVRAIAPLTPIIVVSGNDDPVVMSEVVMAGAAGYVPKSAPRQLLLDAIRMVMGGGSYLPAAAVVALRRAQSEGGGVARDAPSDQLTSRQKRVLTLLAEGLSNKRIARELEISEITVKAHVSLILKKLGVSNRVQAAIEARKRLAGEAGGR
ncbi:MAG TPA: response regulator transcription factor [Steroidobacteraceae bacterium]|nr:response regulator transcription factor [Steroidobacteraceae bacterium]